MNSAQVNSMKPSSKPVIPKSVAPELAAPKPAVLESAAPKLVAPKPAVLESAAPKLVAPKPAVLESAAPKLVAPKPAVLESAAPKLVAPKPAVLESAAPQVAAPKKPAVLESAAPKLAAPKPAVLESAAPKPAAPKPAVLESAAPKPAAPKPATLESGAPKPAAPKPEFELISSELQTKDWRKSQEWYSTGKSNECEIFQRDLCSKIIKKAIDKSKIRIYNIDSQLYEKKDPYNDEDGYEWTEDFDGYNLMKSNKYYFNFKFVCDRGGSQTRTLKEVYSFVKSQFEHLKKYKPTDKYFINILDGDQAHANIDKFKYLENIKENKDFSKYVYVGDMAGFNDWWIHHNK